MILYAAIFRSLCKLKHNQIAFDCVPNERQFADSSNIQKSFWSTDNRIYDHQRTLLENGQ